MVYNVPTSMCAYTLNSLPSPPAPCSPTKKFPHNHLSPDCWLCNSSHPLLSFSLTLYFVLLVLAHSYRPVIQLLSSPLCSSPLLSSDFSSLCSSLRCCRGVSTKPHHCQPAKLPLLFSVLLVCVCTCVLLRHLSLFLYRRYNPGFRLTQSKVRRVIEIGLAAV